MSLRFIARDIFRAIMKFLPDKQAICFAHLCYFHRLPELKNPQRLSDKIAWRKLYQRDPRFTVFADKVAVKDEVAKLVGAEHVIPNLWVGEKPEDIPFDTLTPPYVIKVNHGWGSNIFVRSKDDVDRAKIVETLREQLAHRHGELLREWAYLNIPPKILIEPMLVSPDGGVPDDYKFYVYHGVVHFIEVHRDRFSDHKSTTLFDPQWRFLQVVDPFFPLVEPDLPKPVHLPAMIALAEKIGALFDSVRIDLYNADPVPLFGEATFYTSGGLTFYNPPVWDDKFGEPWHLAL